MELDCENSNEYLNLQAASSIVTPAVTSKEIEEEKARQTVQAALPAFLQQHFTKIRGPGPDQSELSESSPNQKRLLDQIGDRIEYEEDDQ